MKEQIKYEIMTLNPAKIFPFAKEISVNGHREVTFHLRFKKGSFAQRSVLDSTEEKSENALLRQIGLELKKEDPGFVLKPDSFKYRFVLIDFEGLFMNKSITESVFDHEAFCKKTESGFSNSEFEELFKSISTGVSDNEALFFLFRNGFYMETELSDEEIHFVPFDSSASMTRQARVSFIDEKLKEALDDRLLLGMDLRAGGVEVQPNKYFAYRGLYMTDAIRIEAEEAFELNEETVIVVDDFGMEREKIAQITAGQDKAEPDYWNILNKVGDVNINAFDGEGIICPAFAKMINMQLFDTEEGASSFQIRMPFVKGMLHMIDFREFYSAECGVDLNERYEIKDVFGIKRDLGKAGMILTASMVKNHNWMEEYLDKTDPGADPMKVYFDRMKKYDHSLYVARTDANLNNREGMIKLNYQFLNTLDMDRTEFDRMVRKYIDKIRSVENNADSQREMVLGSRKNEWKSAWKYALSKNLGLVNEEYIKEQIRKEIDSRIKDIYRGNIRVKGENRFLSADLLSLLIHIYQQGNYDKAKRNELLKHLIRTNEFRMSKIKPKGDFIEGRDYGFLRNPHLSRNEDCVLRYAKNDDFDKYFSHLSGVIMVANNSLAPMTLGGADYDGDMVKIIADVDIIKAMKKGRESCREVVVIPSAGKHTGPVPSGLSYAHIKDTFGNRIGHISNMAIKLGEIVYGGNPEKEDSDTGDTHSYIPADCTLLTGLEIDAAKSGIHPWKNIEELEGQIKKADYNYLKLLAGLKKLDGGNDVYIYKTETKASGSGVSYAYKIVYRDGYGKEKKSIEILKRVEGALAPNIESLPSYYFETMYKDHVELADFGKKTGFFSFDPDKKERTKEEEKAAVEAKAIADVFNRYCRRFKWLREMDEKQKKSNWYGKVMVIFQRQHFGQGGLGEQECALECIYSALESFITGNDHSDEYGNTVVQRADTIIEKMKSLKWIVTPEKERIKKLTQIIPYEVIEMVPDKYKRVNILTDFSKKGFMTLYYIVCDIRDQNSDVMEKEEKKPIRDKMDENRENENEDYRMMYSRAFKVLNVVYNDALTRKTTYSYFENRMLDSILDNFVKGGIDKYAEAFYCASRPFFWKFFDKERRFEKFKESDMITEVYAFKSPKKKGGAVLPDVEELFDREEDNEYVE